MLTIRNKSTNGNVRKVITILRSTIYMFSPQIHVLLSKLNGYIQTQWLELLLAVQIYRWPSQIVKYLHSPALFSHLLIQHNPTHLEPSQSQSNATIKALPKTKSKTI